MDKLFHKKQSLNLNGKLMTLSTPKVMGILNITPDSFFDGGAYTKADAIKTRLLEMIEEGVDIIDIGAYSSRPGADDISTQEEILRLDMALDLVREIKTDLPISVDTFRSEVAAFVLEKYQVEIINDISGGERDSQMFDVMAQYQAAYIMMHMRGTPKTMTSKTQYHHIIAEILQYFSEKIESLKALGVNDIVIDPGFGFAKTLDQNYELLRQLHLFGALETPILAGLSRKSMLYKLLGCTPQEALNATSIANTLALTQGADILRVHDVKAARECISIYQKTRIG